MAFYIGIQDALGGGLISGGPEIPEACTRTRLVQGASSYTYSQVPGKCIMLYPPSTCFSGNMEKDTAFFRRLKEEFGICRLQLGMVFNNLEAAFRAGWTPSEITLWFDSFGKLKDTGDQWEKYKNGEQSFEEFLANSIVERIKTYSDLYLRVLSERTGIPLKDLQSEREPFYGIYLDEIHEVASLNPDAVGVDTDFAGGYERGMGLIVQFAQIIAALRQIDTTGLFRSIDENGQTVVSTKVIASTYSHSSGLQAIDDIVGGILDILKWVTSIPGSLTGDPDNSPILGFIYTTLRQAGLDVYSENLNLEMGLNDWPAVGGAFDQIVYSGYHGGWLVGGDQRHFWTEMANMYPGSAGAWISLFLDHDFVDDDGTQIREYDRLLGHANNLGWNEISVYALTKDSGISWSDCAEFLEYLQTFAQSAASTGWLKEEIHTSTRSETEYCQSYPNCKECDSWASIPPANWPSSPGIITPVDNPGGIPINKWYETHFTIGL